MKKTLIALAAVAVSSAAMAQVTVSGTYGVAYQSFKNSGVEQKGFAMTDSSIRFAVSEDLGGGLRASGFVQIAGNDSRGGNVTKEDSSLALSGGFGSVSIANTRSSDTAISANVFNSWQPRTAFYDTVSSRAAGDLFTYTLPALVKGLTLSVSQFEVTEGTATSANKVNIIGGSYAAGPLTVAFAQKSTSGAVPAGTEKNNTELAVRYNAGVALIGLGYDGETTTTGKAMTSYGISVPMGAITVGVNGAKRGDRKFYDAGVNYALSNRTTVSLMTGKMTGGSREGNQYRVGVRHNF